MAINPFFKQIIIQAAQDGDTPSDKELSAFAMAKAFREAKINILRWIKDIVLITAGIGSAAFGLESFLLPSNFIDGGATGIALLASEKSTLFPLQLWLVIINIPFVFIGYKTLGKTFAIKAACAIVGLAICVAVVHFPEVTKDKLLVSVFGGFFLGAGIGLAVRGGAVLDGTEVVAIYLSRKLGTTIGTIIIFFNIIIFGVAAYLLTIEAALYSMITYLAASKTVDFVIEGIEEYTGFTIISSHDDEIRRMIINKMGRGVTVYQGSRGYGNHGERRQMDIIYTIVTRLEIGKLKTEIEKIDPHAFVVMTSVKDTTGGMIKKRPLH
jgi:uncharacterized membrane-anchored protein YitT (DUF2179 family)